MSCLDRGRGSGNPREQQAGEQREKPEWSTGAHRNDRDQCPRAAHGDAPEPAITQNESIFFRLRLCSCDRGIADPNHNRTHQEDKPARPPKDFHKDGIFNSVEGQRQRTEGQSDEHQVAEFHGGNSALVLSRSQKTGVSRGHPHPRLTVRRYRRMGVVTTGGAGWAGGMGATTLTPAGPTLSLKTLRSSFKRTCGRLSRSGGT